MYGMNLGYRVKLERSLVNTRLAGITARLLRYTIQRSFRALNKI